MNLYHRSKLEENSPVFLVTGQPHSILFGCSSIHGKISLKRPGQHLLMVLLSIPLNKFPCFDPRPVESRGFDQKKVNNFLTDIQGLPHESNWEAIPVDYDDYEISDEKYFYFNKTEDPIKLEDSRKDVLKKECERFVAYLKVRYIYLDSMLLDAFYFLYICTFNSFLAGLGRNLV